MHNLIACATITHKSTANQDFCVTFENPAIGVAGVIVADGIGSHFKAELASRFCTVKLKEILENLTSLQDLHFDDHFTDVQLALINYAKTTDEFDFNAIDRNQSLGTTLICMLDSGDAYHIAYSGNGSVWQLDGRFNKFPTNFYLPWNAINLLNPHCVEQDGKPALYRYLSVSDTQYRPTVLILNKNQFLPGEIMIATTDGIYSNDAVPVGKDANGTLWIKGEGAMPVLYKHLSDFLSENPVAANNDDLDFALCLFLEDLKDKSMIHDDTTLAVIISEKAIDYHQSEFERKSNP